MIFRDALLRFKYFVFSKNKYSKVEPDENIHFQKSQKDAHIYYTGLGRGALFRGLELLNIEPGDNVLVPAYICRTAIEPFLRKGIYVKYYKIKKDFSPDLRSLKNAVNGKTKALLYVNYFGLANYFEDYQMFCRDNGLYIIEDNAHTLLYDYRLIRGDISIFSLRKFYPIPNGALLVARDQKLIKKSGAIGGNIEKKLNIIDYKFLMGTLARKIYHYLSNRLSNSVLLRFQKIRERFASEGKMAVDIFTSERFSKLSFDIFNHLDLQEIITKRRNNYNFLLNKLILLDSSYFKVIFKELSDCSCPLVFPVMVPRYRENLIVNLFLKGYITYPWPDMPKEVIEKNNDYKDELFLSNTIILLPIHQDLTTKHLDRMVFVIKKWMNKIERNN